MFLLAENCSPGKLNWKRKLISGDFRWKRRIWKYLAIVLFACRIIWHRQPTLSQPLENFSACGTIRRGFHLIHDLQSLSTSKLLVYNLPSHHLVFNLFFLVMCPKNWACWILFNRHRCPPARTSASSLLTLSIHFIRSILRGATLPEPPFSVDLFQESSMIRFYTTEWEGPSCARF